MPLSHRFLKRLQPAWLVFLPWILHCGTPEDGPWIWSERSPDLAAALQELPKTEVPDFRSDERIDFRSVTPVEGDGAFLDHFDSSQIGLLEKLNRADRDNLPTLGSVVLPDRWDLPESAYSPLPREDRWASQFEKALVVDLQSQAFGAYQEGELVHWGPVNSGRRETRTPTGEFFLTWKSEGRHSTLNPEWYLPWYFNFHNRRGLSFHAYKLPGYPASHACLRLLERDARWLFEWGEQWELDERGWEVVEPGTPLSIRGEYDFDAPPPWRGPEGLLAVVAPSRTAD